MRGMVAATVLAVLAFVAIGCACVEGKASGPVPVTVRVTDALSGRRLAGVSVSQVSRTGRLEKPEPVTTDASGEATLRAEAPMGVSNCGFYEETVVSPVPVRLLFEKPGYTPVEVSASKDEETISRTKVFGIGGSPSFRREVRMEPIQSGP